MKDFLNGTITFKRWQWFLICFFLPGLADFLVGFFEGLFGGAP